MGMGNVDKKEASELDKQLSRDNVVSCVAMFVVPLIACLVKYVYSLLH